LLILTNPGTADKLQLTTSAAVTVDVHVSYATHTLSDDNVVAGRQLTAITTATTTDICAGPSSGDVRNVKTIHIRNKHASTSVDVTVIYDASGTDYELHKVTLRAGEALEYVEGIGFFTLESSIASISRRFVLGSDHANSTTTATEATGLTTTTGVGTFKFQYMLRYQTAATTTGTKVSVNHTGTVAFFVYNLLMVDTSATAATGTADQDMIPTTGGVYAGWASRAKSTDGKMINVGVDSANADMLAIVDGLCQVTVDGSLALWWGSEAAASAATLKAGSSLILEKTG